MKPATITAVVLLSFISIAHLLRFVLQVKVTAGDYVVPIWPSLIACIICGTLAILVWLESRP